MRPYFIQFPEWLPLVGGQPLYAYGTMLGISFVIGWVLCVELCKRDRMDLVAVSRVLFTVVLSAVLGARLMHFCTAPDVQWSVIEFFRFSDGGMVAYGGMIAAALSSWIAAHRLKLNWWTFGDNAIPGLSLGLGVTRIGCFLFGCDYGSVSVGTLSLVYPRWDLSDVIQRMSPAYTAHHGALEDIFHAGATGFSHAVHPTQLYESLVGFVLFAALLLRRPYVQFRGELILLFFGGYGIARFFIELFRGDADRGLNVWGSGLSPSQLISITVTALVCSIYWWRRTTHPNNSRSIQN